VTAKPKGGDGQTTTLASVISMRTLKAGRNQTSTKHVGPIPDEAVAGGEVSGDQRAALELLGTRLVTQIQIGGTGAIYVPSIFHRATSTSDQMTNFSVPLSARVMRRRTVGVGI